MEKDYQVKTQLLGPGKNQLKQAKILNRIVAWDEKQGLSYEADPRHAEIIKQQLVLEEAKAVTTPGTKEEGRTATDHEQPLDEEQATKYRALTARCNYLSPDRPDVAFAVQELARNMANPRRGDWTRLKRLGRYLVGSPRLQQWFEWQQAQKRVTTYTDAGWAGCKETRKSTTGGVVTIGTHTVKSWSKTQSLVALSSGESELYAALKASAETLGVMSMLTDFGVTMTGEVWGDASAALGIINRNGLGKTRHIQTGLLWIQQISAQKRISYGKVLGKENPADLFAKYLDGNMIGQHLQKLKCEFTKGRAGEAPKLHSVSLSIDEYNTRGPKQQWEWTDVIICAVESKSPKVQKFKYRNVKKGELNTVERCMQSTNVRQRVLWGFQQRVQGFNGLNAAHPAVLRVRP